MEEVFVISIMCVSAICLALIWFGEFSYTKRGDE